MADNSQLRASDDDRDRAASLLREHHAAGRLTMEEFQERLDAVYAAKTLGEIDEIMADLPSIDLYHLPEASIRRGEQARAAERAPQPGRLSPHWRAAWGSWASVSLLLFTIWLISVIGSGGSNLHNLWFLWVAGPWGAVLLGRWLFGGPPDGHREIAGPPGGPARGLLGEHQEHLADHEQRLDEHLQRHQERTQERLQRHQDRLQRHQDRLHHRHDPPDDP